MAGHCRAPVRLGLSCDAAKVFAYQYSDGNAGPIVSAERRDDEDGATVSGRGVKGPHGNNYLWSHPQVDLQGTYALPMGLTWSGCGVNLDNEVFGFPTAVGSTRSSEVVQTYTSRRLRWSRCALAKG